MKRTAAILEAVKCRVRRFTNAQTQKGQGHQRKPVPVSM